jgi:hypothetical protein
MQLFINLEKLSDKTKIDCGIKGYRQLFDIAISVNVFMAIDKFALIVLEFAPEIYSENDNCFLSMVIPDTNVNFGTGSGNAFGVIRTQAFKDMWIKLGTMKGGLHDRDILKADVMELTCHAHAYFIKSIHKNDSAYSS